MIIEHVSNERSKNPIPMLGLKPVFTLRVIELMDAFAGREDDEELGVLKLLVSTELCPLHHEFGGAEENVVHVGCEWGEEAWGVWDEAHEF